MDYQELISNGKILLKSKIDGSFEGFDNEKLFPLINGQYWMQINVKHWFHYSQVTDITIYEYKGSQFLTVDGQSEFVEVRLLNDIVQATIISDFDGWSGDTVFELDNGEIWRQNEYDNHHSYSYRPKVIIYSTGFTYRMFVEGKNIEVERIQ